MDDNVHIVITATDASHVLCYRVTLERLTELLAQGLHLIE